MRQAMRILGIDPGSRVTGFGILDFKGSRASYVTSGVVRSPEGSFPQRLKRIYEAVGEVVDEFQPDVVAIESVFMARNAGSAL